jgi:threonine synthase
MSVARQTDLAFQRCINPACGATFGTDEALTECGTCGSLLDIQYDWDRLPVPKSLAWFETKWTRRYDPLAFSGHSSSSIHSSARIGSWNHKL